MKRLQRKTLATYYEPSSTTLASWRDNVFSQLDTIKALGMDQRFIRLWEFYLCYCEGGFIERTIGDAQMILERPGATTAPILGSLA